MDLKTTYMGIELKNPLIVGASSLTADVHMVKKLEGAGAAAIVYKSLFEEQIHLEAAELEEDLHEYDDRNAEMTTLFPNIEHSGPKAFLMGLKNVKEAVSIPVIASLNCIYDISWLEYAKYLEETGVDGIELNFYNTITDSETDADDIEKKQVKILRKIKALVSVPVSVKLSPYYTNILNVVKKLDAVGADSFVLFNRLFQPAIDVDDEVLKMPYNLSSKNDSRLTLKYTGLLAGNIRASICASNGIHDAKDVISVLLAGADAIQVVSAIYQNGVEQITTILEDLSVWMKSKNYDTLSEIKGKLSKENLKEPYAYKRSQYVDYFMKSKKIMKDYSL